MLSLPGTQALSNDRIGFLNAAGTDLVTQTTLTQGQSFNIGGIQFTGDGSELQIARSGGTLTITSIGTVAASNLDFEIVSREVAYTAQTSTGQTTDPTAGGGDTVRDIIWSITDNAGTFASGTRNADGSFTATPGVATVKGGTILNVQHSAIVAAGNDSSFVEGQTAKVVIEPFASFTDTNNITSVVLTLPMIPGTNTPQALSTDIIGFLNGTNPLSTTITLTAGSTFGGIAGDGSQFQISRAGGTLTITSIGAVAATNLDFEAASREVAFTEQTGIDPTAGGTDTFRQVIWKITDKNTDVNTFVSGTVNANGSITSTTGDSGFSFISVSAPSSITGTNGVTVTYTEGQSGATPLDTLISINDPINLKSATVAVAGFMAGDQLQLGSVTGATLGALTSAGTAANGDPLVSQTLSFTGDSDKLTATFDETAGTLVLTTTSTTATSADYQAALQAVAFIEAPNNDPTHGGSDNVRHVTWTVLDTGNNKTTASTTLATVHKAPVLTAGVTATFSEGQTGPTLLDSGLTLTDSDPIANASVSVSGFKAGDALLFGTVTGATLGTATTMTVGGDTVITETLTFSDGTITATFDETAGTLGLTTTSGTAGALDYQAALQAVAFNEAANTDPTHGGTDTPRMVSWSVTDINPDTLHDSASATSTLVITHQAPVVSGANGVTVTYTEGQTGPTVLDSGFTFSDSDALTSATVAVSGFQAATSCCSAR